MTAGPAQRVFAAILLLSAALLVPVVLAAPLGMAPLGIVVSLAALAAAGRRHLVAVLRERPMLVLAALGAWGMLGATWAIDPGQTVKTTARLFATGLAGWVALSLAARVPDGQRAVLWRILGLGMAVGLAVILADYLTDKGLSVWVLSHYHGHPQFFTKSPLNRGGTIMIMMVWPVGLAMWRLGLRKGAVALAALAAVTLLVSDSGSMKAAGLTGLVFLAVALRFGKLAYGLLKGGLVLATVAVPAVVYQFPPPEVSFREWLWLPHSAHHRVTIWSFVAQNIGTHPLRGWGLDASRDLPGGEVTINLQRPDPSMPDGIFRMGEQLLPLHPHNAVLQWWLELGGIGVAGLMVLFWLMLGRVERAASDPAMRAVWGATIVTGLVVAAVSYGFWQSWWQASMWLIALFSALLPAARAKE